MKSNKKLLSTIAVYAIVLALFILLVTAIPFTKIASSWVAFSFGVVAIIASCATTLYAFGKGEKVVSKIFGFSLFKLGIIYLALQMVISVAFLALGAFLNVPTWVALIFCVLLLGVCAIGLIVVDNAIDIVEEQEEKLETKIKKVKTFNLNVNTIIAICQNNDFLPHLERLAEAFKYSDPVSNEQTEPLENNLKNEIDTLTTLVATNSENTVSKIKEIEALLSSRNAVCKLSK